MKHDTADEAAMIIKVACARAGISVAELARRLDVSPQAFHKKAQYGRFTVADWRRIADALGGWTFTISLDPPAQNYTDTRLF